MSSARCSGRTTASEAAEVLLKGPEKEIPDGRFFHDKDGHRRTSARIRWWSDSSDPCDYVIGPPELKDVVSALDEFDTFQFGYARDERPFFSDIIGCGTRVGNRTSPAI